MAEIVYLLTNPIMPGLVKIGRTTDLEGRLRDLSRHTGVPVPFECFYACEVANSAKVETALHNAFGDHRINPRREFFRLNPDRAVAFLELLSLGNAAPLADIAEDPVELDALQREQNRREQFRFSLADVPVGAELVFSRDTSVSALVVDDRRIEFEGQITSTSSAARTILSRLGLNWTQVQGPLYWMYKGETLVERRTRLEGDISVDVN